MAALNFTAPDLAGIQNAKDMQMRQDLERLVDSTAGNWARYKQAKEAVRREKERDERERKWDEIIMARFGQQEQQPAMLDPSELTQEQLQQLQQLYGVDYANA